MEHIFSWVRRIAQKLVRQFVPWIASVICLDFLNTTSSSCRATSLTFKTWSLRPSGAILVPWVLKTNVFLYFLQSSLEQTSSSWFLFCHIVWAVFFVLFFVFLKLGDIWDRAECGCSGLHRMSNPSKWPSIFSFFLVFSCILKPRVGLEDVRVFVKLGSP